MNSQFETIDAETIKITYEDVSFSNDNGTVRYKQDLLGAGIQKAIDLDKKLYKNRYNLERNDENIIPSVKMKRLDDKIYRASSKRPASLIKDFDNHKIRTFKFSSI
jgi:hypothetical protein